MTYPFDANCQALAPFDLPYRSFESLREAQQRWTPHLFTWTSGIQHPVWYSAAAGFPGLVEDRTHVNRIEFEQALEEHQLAFLQNNLEYTTVAELESQLLQLRHLPEHSTMQALVLGLYGPLSLGLTLVDELETPIWHDELVRDVLLEHIRLRSTWLEQQVGGLAPTTIICLLEPFWSVLYSPFVQIDAATMLSLIAEATQPLQTTVGLAPAGEVDWLPLLESSLQFFSCQPYQQAGLLACAGCLNDYFERGGTIAWALVPATAAELDQTTPEQIVAFWDQLLKRGLEHDVLNSRMLSGSFITTAAGLRSQPLAVAERALACLAEVVYLIRSRYKLA